MIADLDLFERDEDALEHDLRLTERSLGERHHELVRTGAAREVERAGPAGKALADRVEDLVAHRVAALHVEVAEAIDVEDRDGQGRP